MGFHLDAAERPDPLWANHVDAVYRDELDLFSAAEAVEALVAHPGWVHVERLLEAEQRSTMDALSGRLHPEIAKYAFEHGRLNGLGSAVHAAQAILSRARKRLVEQQKRFEAGDRSPAGV